MRNRDGMPQYLCYIAIICSYNKSGKCDSQSRRFREFTIFLSHPLRRGLKYLKQPTCLQTNAVHLEYFHSLASALHKLLLLFIYRKSVSSMAQPSAVKLLDLPTELLLQIIGYLDYLPGLNLSHTNSFFKSIVTLTSEQKRSFLCEAETWRRYVPFC